jgi:Family of unknown function (DUF6524)
MESFTPLGFALRLLGAIVLVLCTFNPTGYSFYHWVAGSLPAVNPAAVVVGILLLGAWVVFLGATMRSLGLLGIVIVLAFFGAVVWMVVSWGWLDPRNGTAMAWITLVVLAVILAIGVSWSHMRRRLTGQADVDEVDAK